jgi:hypothetical protein
MSNNPINLALRFILELAGLVAMAYWGWTTHDGAWQWITAIGLPVIAAALWGTFRIPNDPKPDPPVVVPGPVRLLLEAVYFAAAVILLVDAGKDQTALILGVVIVLHYIVSYDRVIHMLRNQPF